MAQLPSKMPLDLMTVNSCTAPWELTPLRRLTGIPLYLENQDCISWVTQRNTGGKFHLFSPGRYNKLNEILRFKNIYKSCPGSFKFLQHGTWISIETAGFLFLLGIYCVVPLQDSVLLFSKVPTHVLADGELKMLHSPPKPLKPREWSGPHQYQLCSSWKPTTVWLHCK